MVINEKKILSAVQKLHDKARQSKAKSVKINGETWLVQWNQKQGCFDCIPPESSEEFPIAYNTRSQAQACKWLKEYFA